MRWRGGDPNLNGETGKKGLRGSDRLRPERWTERISKNRISNWWFSFEQSRIRIKKCSFTFKPCILSIPKDFLEYFSNF